MQLNHLHTEFSCGIYLFQRWIDKETDVDTCGLESSYGMFKFFSLRHNIETSFSSNLFAFLWNETCLIRNDEQGGIDDLWRVAHFEVQFGHDILSQPLDIAILNVATIASEVSNYSPSPGTLADRSRCNRIGLRVFRVRHRRVARLSQGRNVINVYSAPHRSHGMFNRSHPITRIKQEWTKHFISMVSAKQAKLLGCTPCLTTWTRRFYFCGSFNPKEKYAKTSVSIRPSHPN